MIFFLLSFCGVHGLSCTAEPARGLTKKEGSKGFIEICLHVGTETTMYKIRVDEYASLVIEGSKDTANVDGDVEAFVSVVNKEGGNPVAESDAGCNHSGKCSDFHSNSSTCIALQSCKWDAAAENTCVSQPRANNDVISSCGLKYKTSELFAPIGNIIIELDKGDVQRIRIDNSCSNCDDESVVHSHSVESSVSPSTCMCGEKLSGDAPTQDYNVMVAFAGTDAEDQPLTSEDKSYSKFVSGSATLSSFTALIKKQFTQE